MNNNTLFAVMDETIFQYAPSIENLATTNLKNKGHDLHYSDEIMFIIIFKPLPHDAPQ